MSAIMQLASALSPACPVLYAVLQLDTEVLQVYYKPATQLLTYACGLQVAMLHAGEDAKLQLLHQWQVLPASIAN